MITRKQSGLNRALALKNGDRTFQGTTCKRGHTEKYTSSRCCVECKSYFTDERKAYKRQYNNRPGTTELRFRNSLKNYYDITPEYYYEMLESQQYRCKICFGLFTNWERVAGTKRDTAVDHCHITGMVRGILCGDCNHAIGRLKDDPNHCANAVSYLISTKPSSILPQ